MNLILLSGGSGKRLWPLSNDIRSKQFIRIFKNDENEYESMVQRVYRQILNVDSNATVTIATSKSQVSAIHNQLGDDVAVCIEPCRRDTFPAIALATCFLHDVKGIDENEVVVVCPVDPFVDEEYFKAIKNLCELAGKNEANLVLMGINPTEPSEKYGYIIPITDEKVSKVSCFKEKPDLKTAAEYISQGALWNGGVFAFTIKYLLKKAHELISFKNYSDLLSKYETLKKISFDYAVVENEQDIAVMRFNGKWADLGTWNTLTEAMEERIIGDVKLDEKCENVYAINDIDLPIICMGLKDTIVCASPDGILVADRERSSAIKPYAEEIQNPIRFADKSWGKFQVIDVGDESMTIKISLLPGHRLHYHSHQYRDETWTVIKGNGMVIIDDSELSVKPGSNIRLPRGCRHTIIAETEMSIIEVQTGKEISAEDKVKYSLKSRFGEHQE